MKPLREIIKVASSMLSDYGRAAMLCIPAVAWLYIKQLGKRSDDELVCASIIWYLSFYVVIRATAMLFSGYRPTSTPDQRPRSRFYSLAIWSIVITFVVATGSTLSAAFLKWAFPIPWAATLIWKGGEISGVLFGFFIYLVLLYTMFPKQRMMPDLNTFINHWKKASEEMELRGAREEQDAIKGTWLRVKRLWIAHKMNPA